MSHLTLVSSTSPEENVKNLIKKSVERAFAQYGEVNLRLFNLSSSEEQFGKDSPMRITHGLLGKTAVNKEALKNWIAEQNFGEISYSVECAGNYDADIQFLILHIKR